MRRRKNNKIQGLDFNPSTEFRNSSTGMAAEKEPVRGIFETWHRKIDLDTDRDLRKIGGRKEGKNKI